MEFNYNLYDYKHDVVYYLLWLLFMNWAFFLSFSIEEARIKNFRTMETLQNNNVWEYFATVGAIMKSYQLSLILDVVNPLISILSAELMFHIIFMDLIPLFFAK